MQIAIDQSLRIEWWTKPSFIGFSDGKQKAIVLPSALKRECLAVLKSKGKSEDTAKWMIFAAGIFVLIREDLPRIQKITIDQDFAQRTMKDLRHWLWQKIRLVVPHFELKNVDFAPIKRKHPAHLLVHGLYTGKISAHTAHRVTSRQILPLFKK